jgi:UDP-glucose:(heptosyl)LPS alpha-1,3-glucosyltransferase
MKIAFLIKRFNRSGGKERYVVELAKALTRQGHNVHIYACTCDQTLLNGITFHPVVSRYDFSGILNTLSFIRETDKMVSTQAYDIVHSHERNYRQKILTLHSLSYCQGLEKYSFLRRMDQKYLSLRSLLYLWLEKRQMKSPWLVTVSREVSRDVEKYYRRDHQMIMIPPGVDIDQFDPMTLARLRGQARKENNLQQNELAVLFVGSAFQRKGLDRILPFIQGDMRLFVVGKGDKLGKYKHLIQASGLEKKVFFAGMVKDMKPYYALADMVVLPSLSEAFGMSILEGMACGLPVIVTQNCGVADLIDHNVNGLIMKKEADLGIYLGLLSSKEERFRLGASARKTARDHTWQKVCLDHEVFYKRLLSGELSV